MFVHLHLHTEFSLVDSLIRIEAPARKSAGANVQTLTGFAARLGLPAIAVTDQDNLFAMVKFYKLAEGAGVKPIIGADVSLAESGDADSAECVTLLVQNATGYRNLTRIVSRAFQEGQTRGRPRIQRAWLAEASDGLIALSGKDGEIGRALLAGRLDHARSLLPWWHAHFPDRLYLEITRCGRPNDESHLAAAVAFARETGLPVVASNDVRFLERSDFDAHEARVCISGGRVISDERRPRDYTPEQYLKSADEMAALFADLPEAIENTLQIARRCTLSLKFGENHLPDYPVPEGMTVSEYLRKTAEDGMQMRFATQGASRPAEEYQKRLDYELAIIERMGFGGYFLVVADFIRWGKNNGVPVGPGRGSGAGSLVAYAIGITDLDPLPYNLLFERFLNPERVSLPDFDVDFCIEGRDRVIAYVAEKYGRERVSQIITYGSMAARAVVRDVVRVLGLPYGLGDRIAKLIPGAPAYKAEAEKAGCSVLEYAVLKDANNQELQALYRSDEEVRNVVDLGMALEDLTRGVGIHAGGVVIAPKPLTEYSPMFCEAGGAGLRTQFDMKDCETVGLVKFDFLGLRTLTIIESAVQQINAPKNGKRPEKPLDILQLPLDDPKAYRLYADGQTTAVFQMESQGMQRASVDLKPDCFEDIIALISLYRPGPMDLIPQYCRRKHGQEPVSYLHPDMEGVLKPTYGNFVYQEQVMQMAQVLAGYSLGGADLLRRAMGKKKPEEMAQQRGIFEKGAADRGIDTATASAVFDLMEKFAGYGFNKSHAAAYALVSYQTAWLKAHYPAEFMAAVMSAEMSHTDTVVVMLEECRRMKLTVLPPDVNSSEYRFTVNAKGEILYGLGAVKGAGEGAIDGIISERRANGRFSDLFDFCRRIDTKKANRRVLEALIGAGAMDGFQLNRPSLMKTLPKALQLAEQTAASAGAGIADLFGLGAPASTSDSGSVAAELEPDWEPNERLSVEKKVLGLYLSGHPVEAYRGLIDQVCSGTFRQLIDEAGPPPEFAPSGGGDDDDGAPAPRRRGGFRKQVMLAGWLTDIRTIMGDRPGKILVLDDRTSQLVCWLDFQDWQRFQTMLKPDTLIFATGSINASQREGRELEYRLSPKSFYDLDALMRERAERVTLTWKKPAATVQALPQRLAPWRNPNGAAVTVDYWNGVARATLDWGADWRLRFETAAEAELKRLLGPDSIRVDYRRWVAPVSTNARSRAEYDDGE